MLKTGRYFRKEVELFPKAINSISIIRCCRVISQLETGPPQDVVIQPRVEREPTDILRALASTVEADFTAFDYKYPDDPYFYSYTFFHKKILAMSLESGRKSAKWIAEKNPGLFKHVLSDPPIKAFLLQYDKNSELELTEQTLINAINGRNVLKAIEVFKALKEKNLEVSKSTKQCLLELVCFYNCEEKPQEELEKKWFLLPISLKQEANTWKNNDFAQELFESMDSGCPLAKSAIIQGMAKYNEMYKASAIFKEAITKKIKLPVDAYNAYLSKLYIIGGRNVLNFIREVLVEMARQKITPNLGTLNAVLESLLKAQFFPERARMALQTVGEFESLGIKPSLGSYGLFFSIIGRTVKSSENVYEPIMQSIMEKIQDKEHEIVHPSDLIFFLYSMEAFSNLRCDLALNLDNMLWKNNNSKFMTKYIDLQLYFKKFFLFLFKTKPIDVGMKAYKKYISMFSLGDLKIVRLMLDCINENLASEYLLFVWEEFTKTNMTKNIAVLRLLLPSIQFFTDESSLKILYRGACLFFEYIKPSDLFREDGETIAHLLMVFVKNDDQQRVSELIKVFGNNLDQLNLKDTIIETIFEYAVLKENVVIVQSILRLAFNVEHSKVNQMVKKALPLLNDDDKAWATHLLQKKERRK